VQAPFLAGVIEGFYGRPWSFETRTAYADYLQLLGLDTYIYCPKADPYLRKRWHEQWPASEFAQLEALSATYRSRSLRFGIGLSPFALYENYGSKQRDLLARKVDELNALQAPILAVLFDDMPGEIDSLASRQCEIIADIVNWSSATRVLVCPTYYSFDPVLEKYFGRMPEDYWPRFGAELAAGVDVLWTGNNVCSDSVSVEDIGDIRQRLGRAVVLWDNYPVNDGAIRSNFLYGSKLAERDPGLSSVLQGHLCNPMNQGVISLLALRGLAELYGRSSIDLRDPLGSETFTQLACDMEDFQQLGLTGLGPERCRELSDLYGKMPGAAAQEVAAWLRGEYTFDPACLTD